MHAPHLRHLGRARQELCRSTPRRQELHPRGKRRLGGPRRAVRLARLLPWEDGELPEDGEWAARRASQHGGLFVRPVPTEQRGRYGDAHAAFRHGQAPDAARSHDTVFACGWYYVFACEGMVSRGARADARVRTAPCLKLIALGNLRAMSVTFSARKLSWGFFNKRQKELLIPASIATHHATLSSPSSSTHISGPR